jgi:two-component system, NarL family, sensor kinase
METNTLQSEPLLVALGQMDTHGHLCSIYESPGEGLAVAMPFTRIGLDRGEKCIYVADDGTEGVVLDAMLTEGIDVAGAIASDSLVLANKEFAYLKNGAFDPEWMFAFWADETAAALSQGFSALRVTGETEWLLGSVRGLERWVEYESRVSEMLANQNCFLLCQYNRQVLPPQLILDVIRTHPIVVYRGVVCRNMYYVPPDELLADNHAAREVDRMLTNIRDREQVEAALRASEERWRSVFENSAIGMAVGDAAAKLLTSNQAYQDLVGYSLEELQTMTVYDLTHEDDIALNIKLRGELVAGERREMQMEKQLRRKDGRVLSVRVTSSLIPATDRTPARVLTLVEDITARCLAERERDASLGQSRALAGRLMHAQDDERRRIAQMLHETTAQDLAALKMHLARLNRTANNLSEGERAALTESIHLAEQSMREIRTLSYLLHPPFLDETGLASALRWYVTGFTERSGIQVILELPESLERLPQDTETALFRIVQESLTNIHRHAESESARIRLQCDGATLVLEIEDRGHGMPKASLEQIVNGAGNAGVGIAGMSERIEELSGRFTIDSDEHGTTVRVHLPLIKDDS